MKKKKQKIDHTPPLGDDTIKVFDAVMLEAAGRTYMPLDLAAIQELTGLRIAAVTEAINKLNESGKLKIILGVEETERKP